MSRAAWLIVLVSVAGLSAGSREARLVDAVKAGDRDAIRVLLKEAATVNTPEADGTTALHWAVRADDLETVHLLLRAGADPKAANRYGVTPLSLAAVNGDPVLIETLLKAGGDPNARSEGQTVLMIAARTGNPAGVTMLVAYGANVNAKEEALGETALMWAAAENHPEAAKVLIDSGADLNARSNALKFSREKFGDGIVTVSSVLPRGSWTPLMYAARQGALDSVRVLAEAGADLNLVSPDGSTAMVLAIINAHYDVAALLAEKGADPNVADVTGMSALYAAVDMHTLPETAGRPNPKPSGNLDSLDIVKVLLAHGANPNARLKAPAPQRNHFGIDATLGEGATPLMRAAKKGDISIMRLLLAKGADRALTTKNHTSALMFTAGRAPERSEGPDRSGSEPEMEEEQESIVLCLDPRVDINATNDNGQTALHAAAAQGNNRIVKLLVERGARLDLKDKQGRTALDVARGVGARGGQAAAHDGTATLLRQLMSGAHVNGVPASR